MQNLLDIRCPECGNTDDIFASTAEGEAVYLGPWWLPEDQDKVIGLIDAFQPDTLISCDACGHEAPFVEFDGGIPARIRRDRGILNRFREAITLDYRRK